ncbi:MAG TPA: DUF3300 domain-containing protein, partial [Pyrinomonadaceae bacterium]|nr:DUF3300 domain-containing protein [Pyrinomonadaceae bacterium]
MGRNGKSDAVTDKQKELKLMKVRSASFFQPSGSGLRRWFMRENESLTSSPLIYVHAQTGKSSLRLLVVLLVATFAAATVNIYPKASQNRIAAGTQHADVQNLGREKRSASVWGPATEQQSVDALTAPIALYPDALIAQILICSTNPSQLEQFAGWMTMKNDLQGSAMQDAAQSAGFEDSFVAIAPFPSVVKMMADNMSWTADLGQAFSSDRNSVFDSIQRLRAQAQAAGNLESTDQQEVQIQTTSDGQQVIVIQPTNPQVVYLPTYNLQTVYTTRASAAAAVGFTSGVI